MKTKVNETFWNAATWLAPLWVPAVFIALLLLIGLVWAALSGDGGGCTYGSGECGDPSWQNVPPGY
jgi:hypothetical protein